MRILELFAGTCSFSSVARSLGCSTFTSDIDESFQTDYTVDVMNFDISKIPFTHIDIVWASPPCEGFSVASIGRHWNTDNTPKTLKAEQAVEVVQKTIEIIERLKPTYFIIENPRGKLRKLPFMQGFMRHTVTYCQYGDTRMKPTDLWTNIPNWQPKPMCRNGMPCHVAAPRGSRTGTQGIKTYKNRSRVPEKLCQEILLNIKGGTNEYADYHTGSLFNSNFRNNDNNITSRRSATGAKNTNIVIKEKRQ